MRLLEAIVAANHARAPDADKANLATDSFTGGLPLIALTCIDSRLNDVFPGVLGIPEESFIWLRNAGNIITSPVGTTMRSLALACAIKGGKEIAVIGHTDCLVGKTTALTLIDNLAALGVPRARLPENLTEFFGLFASERQNVIKAAEFVRQSPFIGPAVPVHGLLLDTRTGRLEWLVNGYQTPASSTVTPLSTQKEAALDALQTNAPGPFAPLGNASAELQIGDVKFPERTIANEKQAAQWLKDVEIVDPTRTEPVPVTAAADTTESDLVRRFDKARRFKVIGTDNKVYGPIQGFQILKWIAEGRIDWKTPAQAEGGPDWRPLKDWVGRPPPPPVPDSPLPPTLQAALRIFKDKTRR
jgi:carbonic anhydrase